MPLNVLQLSRMRSRQLAADRLMSFLVGTACGGALALWLIWLTR